jgi:vacuolar iron transporter family protein
MRPEAGIRPKLPESQPERHPHIPARRIIDRIVLGGSDGAIESVAILSALDGAKVAFSTILLAGFAFAAAGSISMFFSSYLAVRSEQDSLRIDAERERMEIETEPEEEKSELRALLNKEGYSEREVDVIMGRLTKNKELWLKEQLSHELRVHLEDLTASPFGRPASAGVAFFAMALLTLFPYAGLVGQDYTYAFFLSVVFSIVALFVLGSKVFTFRHVSVKAGMESAAIGGVAAVLLYIVGSLASGL